MHNSHENEKNKTRDQYIADQYEQRDPAKLNIQWCIKIVQAVSCLYFRNTLWRDPVDSTKNLCFIL